MSRQLSRYVLPQNFKPYQVPVFSSSKKQVQLFRNHTQFTTIALLVLILILLLYLLAESNRRSNAIDKRLQQSPTEKLISQ